MSGGYSPFGVGDDRHDRITRDNPRRMLTGIR
jgi:hypothetical protein